MVIENQIPKTEMVYELKDKYETPSFEEFMKTYKSDDNLNYDDLTYSDIGEVKGYGPCSSYSCPYNTCFYLKIGFGQDRLFNWHFREGNREFEWIICENIEQARTAERKLRNGIYRVAGATGDSNTTNAGWKKHDVMLAFQSWMLKHEEHRETVHEVVDLNNSTYNMLGRGDECVVN